MQLGGGVMHARELFPARLGLPEPADVEREQLGDVVLQRPSARPP